MISAIAIIDLTGEVLLLKTYRRDFNQSAFENYRLSVISQNESPTPTVLIDGNSFCCHLENDLYYVACTRQNADASLIFQLLTEMPTIFAKTLNITSINDQNIGKFTADIIEILDEMIDSGYPQITDPEALQLLCQKQDPLQTQVPPEKAAEIAIGPLPWRQPNIAQKKQSVYVDIIEKFSLRTNADGTPSSTFIEGVTKMNTMVNGTPVCNLTLNSNTINIDDIIFHKCVKLDKFDSNKEISFTPPNGPFELMRYKKEDGISPPFEIKPTVQISSTKFDLVIKVTATYDESLKASPFTLNIPLPQRAANVHCDGGRQSKVKFNDLENSVIWTVADFAGHSTAQIHITAQYLGGQIKSSNTIKGPKPMTAEFHIPKLSTSGLSILNLSFDSKEKPELYVRYTTENGNYQINIPGLDEGSQQ